jgi:serine phosphatase RsbU (regulator of sigma subunit)
MREALASASDAVLGLVIVEGDDPGRWIPLGTEPVTAGRDAQLDIVLSGSAVSRLHLLVTAIDGAVVVEDLGSTNGTFIDGQRLGTRGLLPVGSVLRVGDHIFRCERRGRREMERAMQERRDLERAATYVRSLLAQPLSDGPMRTEWMFLPSARLGGDAFGYQQLDARTFMIYLLDVSGHGVGAAMHSVSVLNVLRQRAVPQTDFKDPVQVVTNLNSMFQMDCHDEQYFTMWYGVYDALDRTVTYASAGHHPAYLVAPDRATALPLKTSGLMVGAMPDSRARAAKARIPAGSRLYLFSDGVFEVMTREGQWRLDDFVALLREPIVSGTSECQRLYRSVKAALDPGQFEDDVSLLVVTFP